ncbi:MAG: DsrE family protein [Polyangiaceae bacterium]|nr:DsrE family protein [Polyangiaceae bacterium]
MTDQPFDLQFVIASGPSQCERAVFGFAAALAAAHSGSRVVVALTMHGAHWGAETSGREESVHGFPPVAELIELLQEAGGRVEACATCVDNYCPSPVGADGLKQLGFGIERVGLGVIAMRMSDIPTTLC